MSKVREPLRQIFPWIVSGASGVYIMRRARQLSVAEPCAETFAQFLVHKGDLIIFIVGGPAAWHFARRSRDLLEDDPGAASPGSSATRNAFHQLRQVFTVLTLGLELLRRRWLSGDSSTMLPLLVILRRVLQHGQEALTTLEREYMGAGEAMSMTQRGSDRRHGQPQ
jgi:hypothetical protein